MKDYLESDLIELSEVYNSQKRIEKYVSEEVLINYMGVGLLDKDKGKEKKISGKLADICFFDKVFIKEGNVIVQIEFAGMSHIITSIETKDGLIFSNDDLIAHKDVFDQISLCYAVPFARRLTFGNIIADIDIEYMRNKNRTTLFYPNGRFGHDYYLQILTLYLERFEKKLKVD